MITHTVHIKAHINRKKVKKTKTKLHHHIKIISLLHIWYKFALCIFKNVLNENKMNMCNMWHIQNLKIILNSYTVILIGRMEAKTIISILYLKNSSLHTLFDLRVEDVICSPSKPIFKNLTRSSEVYFYHKSILSKNVDNLKVHINSLAFFFFFLLNRTAI